MSRLKGNRCYEKMENRAYPVGVWMPPLPECVSDQETLNARYAEARAAGINLINATFEYGTPGALERCLEAARVNGQRVMIGMPHENEETCLELVRKTRNHPAVIGYTMKDEPTAEHFPQLGRLRDKLRAEAGDDKFVMCNLLPNYFTTWDDEPDPETGRTLYQTYLKDYMDTVRPDCLSLDHYPFNADPVHDTSQLRCFLKNFADIRNFGTAYGVETWGFIQCSKWKGMREPNDEELRFVINMHLAFGVKQLTYFLYWQPWEPGLAKDGNDYSGMITYRGEQTEIYRRAVRIDEEWRGLGNAYPDYDNEGFMLTNLDGVFEEALSEAPILRSFGPVTGIRSEGKFFTGCFDNGTGGKGLFLVNFDYHKDGAAEAVIELDGERTVKVWSKNGPTQQSGRTVTVAAAPGEGMFIELL